MSRSRISAAIAGLSVCFAASAGAQVSAVLTAAHAPGGGTVTAFGYYMSPYTGTVDGATQRLNCVDFFHEVSVGETWTAVTTNLGAAITNNSLLANTRNGSNGYYTTQGALEAYEKVAWLTTQYPQNPANDPTLSTAIQTAIWAIASNDLTNQYVTNPGNFVGTFNLASLDAKSTGYWINQANLQFDKQAAGFYDSFVILTDVNKRSRNSAQEFLYSTPEPGTLILFGTGMLFVIGLAIRGRRAKQLAQIPAAA